MQRKPALVSATQPNIQPAIPGAVDSVCCSKRAVESLVALTACSRSIKQVQDLVYESGEAVVLESSSRKRNVTEGGREESSDSASERIQVPPALSSA